MKELAEALTAAAASDTKPSLFDPSSEEIFNEAAQKWAAHSLKTYQGELLRRALAISAALADFTAWFEQPTGAAPKETPRGL